MEKQVQYKGSVDYPATLGRLGVGEYVLIPTSDNDISSIRSIVARLQKSFEGKVFSVHKTANGARIDRES